MPWNTRRLDAVMVAHPSIGWRMWTRAGLAILLGLAGCKPAEKPAAAPAVAEVTMVTVGAHDVGLHYIYSGRVTAFRQVEVRARVGGLLLRRNFVEGAQVRAGDLLFQIDPALYQVAVARAAAQVQQQSAQKEKADRDVRRANALMSSPAGSIQNRDDAASAAALAAAQLAASQADLRSQTLSLSWTTVTAPISGVTSLEAVPEGSLVGTGTDNSLLTRITQTNPIYVTFAFDSDDLGRIRNLAGPGAKLTAQVVVEGRAIDGVVDFTDSSVDQSTGTIRGRALFVNPDNYLQPGEFVRVTLGGVTLRGALTVPKIAVGQDETGAYVYVTNKGRARRVDVTLGPDAGEEVVTTGIHPGDEVVVSGLARVREGGEIRVTRPTSPGA